jgi:OLD-like protein/putative AbiEii toxin of type IV toxin-antitoxin system
VRPIGEGVLAAVRGAVLRPQRRTLSRKLSAHKAPIRQLLDAGALTAKVAKYARHLRLGGLRRFKRVEEFRIRAGMGARSGALETMTGGETASVLPNLWSHRSRSEQLRYQRVVEVFKTLFPRYTLDAVEASPGSGQPVVQIWEDGRDAPLSLAQLSAGVHQILSFLVNLLGQQRLSVFIEHPEQHLHPHGMRFVHAQIIEAAHQNQVVIVTHDPHFCGPDVVGTVRRSWWTAASGSVVHGPSHIVDRQLAQVQTVLRSLSNREVLFARAVILVEDDSQRDFLLAVAPTLGHDVNALGLSVVQVGGEDGYQPFFTLLNSLRIPYVALKDRLWDQRSYPAARFFAFGCELEDFLDHARLGSERQSVIAEVGTSKRRVAGALGRRLGRQEVPPIFRRHPDRSSGTRHG